MHSDYFKAGFSVLIITGKNVAQSKRVYLSFTAVNYQKNNNK